MGGLLRHDVMSLFHVVDLDVLDATSFFQLLDEDQDGAVDLAGFVMGCLRMKGNSNRIAIEISVQKQGGWCEIRWMLRKGVPLGVLSNNFFRLFSLSGSGRYCRLRTNR